MTPRHSRDSGFTLLEAIVALVIMATVMIPLLSFVSATAQALISAAETNERSFAQQAAIAMLDAVNPADEPKYQFWAGGPPVGDFDDWLVRLEAKGHFVSCSSGTTGKSAMMNATPEDLLFGSGQWLTEFRWWHAEIVVGAVNPLQQLAFGGLTGNDGRISGFQFCGG